MTSVSQDETASPCVARQYSGTLGKTGKCQVGMSVHLVNEHASCGVRPDRLGPRHHAGTSPPTAPPDDAPTCAGGRRRRYPPAAVLSLPR